RTGSTPPAYCWISTTGRSFPAEHHVRDRVGHLVVGGAGDAVDLNHRWVVLAVGPGDVDLGGGRVVGQRDDVGDGQLEELRDRPAASGAVCRYRAHHGTVADSDIHRAELRTEAQDLEPIVVVERCEVPVAP